jgi:hypothetical protein
MKTRSTASSTRGAVAMSLSIALRGISRRRAPSVPAARAVALRRRPEIKLISPKKFPGERRATGRSASWPSGRIEMSTSPERIR